MTNNDLRLQYKRATGLDANNLDGILAEVNINCIIGDELDDIKEIVEDIDDTVHNGSVETAKHNSLIIKLNKKLMALGELNLDVSRDIEADTNNIPYIAWLEELYINSITAKDKLFR